MYDGPLASGNSFTEQPRKPTFAHGMLVQPMDDEARAGKVVATRLANVNTYEHQLEGDAHWYNEDELEVA